MSSSFEQHRAFLRSLAYRMLGTVSDIDDVLQDAWLRWHTAAPETVVHPRSFLARIVTNLCLDRLKSSQVQRECYVGEWLPEPVVAAIDYTDPGPEALSELASDLGFAFMRALEALSPPERAAFLLHDVFDIDFASIATTLNFSEANCRQLAVRARAHIRQVRPVAPLDAGAAARLRHAFATALSGGALSELTRMLAEDVVFYSDGGGRVAAVPKPLHGAARVAQVLLGFAKLYAPGSVEVLMVNINGLPGFRISDSGGQLIQVIALEPNLEGRIQAIYVQRNPEKLRHLGMSLKS